MTERKEKETERKRRSKREESTAKKMMRLEGEA
jgi:hypothetical protein